MKKIKRLLMKILKPKKKSGYVAYFPHIGWRYFYDDK